MKKIKSIAILIAVLALFVVALCFNVSSEPSIYREFDSRTGVLYISGSGELKDLYDLEYEDDHMFSDCEHGANELCSECWEYEIEHIVIGKGITSINHCFFNLYNLKTLSLPDTLKEIKGGSFISCSNLRSFTLPESVTVIDNAFNECYSLEWVNIPKNIKTLCGFGGARLSHIEIPRTVKKLALWSDTIDKIYIPETVTAEMLKASGEINEYVEADFGENRFTGLKITSPDCVVTGYNKSAAKDWAKNQKNCTFKQISPVPAKIKAKNYNKHITITWEKVDKTDNWTLFRREKGEKSWTKLVTVENSVTSYNDKGVAWGKTYQYALKGDRNKIYTYVDIGRIERPTGLECYATSELTATLKWNKVENAKYYYIYNRVVNHNPYGSNSVSYKKIAKVDAKYNYYKFTSEKLGDGCYNFYIRAHDGTSYSSYSVGCGTFEYGDIGITSFKPDSKNNTITVKWHTAKNLSKVNFYLRYYGYVDGEYTIIKKETVTAKASGFKTSGNYTYVTIKPKTDLDCGAYTIVYFEAESIYSVKPPSSKQPYSGYVLGFNVEL